MTAINKLIEEEAEKKYLNLDDGDFLDSSDEEKLKAFKAGANFIRHHYRWRKVSEELPEVRKEHYFINIKKSGVRIDTIAILSGIEDVKEYLEFYGVTEWKPIE